MKKTIIFLFICLYVENFLMAVSTVHVFGDSHSLFCFSDKGKLDHVFAYKNVNLQVIVHWIPGKTMHGVGKDGLAVLDFKGHGVKEGDIVVLVYGEVDVRCHIGKQRDLHHRALDEIIDTLIYRYLITINQNRDRCADIHCVVMQIMPPTNRGYNPDAPYYGSLNDRVLITKLFNKKLQEACLENKLLFLPTHDIIAAPDGTFKAELSDTSVHVGFDHNYLIKQRLINFLSQFGA